MVSIRFPKAMQTELEKVSKECGRTLTDTILTALDEFLQDYKKKNKLR